MHAVHDAALEAADRPYLAPWGRTEVRISSVATVLLTALLVVVALSQWPWAWVAVPPVLALGGFLVLFFRNPCRTVPNAPGLLVAPADGTIWDVENVESHPYRDFIDEPCVRIGVFLSIFDVHVNRSPTSGEVVWTRYEPGKFHDARSPLAAQENESNSVGLICHESSTAKRAAGAGNDGPNSAASETTPDADKTLGDGRRLVVKQISGAIARRIICPVGEGTPLRRGGLMGMIKYGSRTELYIPLSCAPEVLVKVRQKVRGGETVLAKW